VRGTGGLPPSRPAWRLSSSPDPPEARIRRTRGDEWSNHDGVPCSVVGRAAARLASRARAARDAWGRLHQPADDGLRTLNKESAPSGHHLNLLPNDSEEPHDRELVSRQDELEALSRYIRNPQSLFRHGARGTSCAGRGSDAYVGCCHLIEAEPGYASAGSSWPPPAPAMTTHSDHALRRSHQTETSSL
jgi:hypothetical protein